MEDTIGAAYDQQVGGDAGEPVAPQVAAETSAVADTPEGAGEGTAQQQQEGQGEEQLFDWSQVPQELLAQAKGFQKAFTQKAQALAEQRKAVEAQAQQYQAYAALEQLAQSDPALAGQILSAQLGLTVGGVQAAGGETDPYSQIQPQTDVEQFLLDRLRQVEGRFQHQDSFIQQQVQTQNRQQLDAEFAGLEKLAGRELPQQEREQIAAECLKRGRQLPDGTWVGPTVSQMYRELNWEQAIAQARQAGRDEAAGVVQQKAAGTPPPAGTVNRAPTTTELPKDPKKLISAIYDQHVSRG